MNHKIPILAFVLILSSLFSCKQTQDVVSDEPVQQQRQMAPVKNEEASEEQIRNRTSRGLSVAEIQVLDDYAKRKADIICKIDKLQQDPAPTDEQAVANKEKIIQLESRLKGIEVEINQYLDSDVRIHYFHKALEQAIYLCSK